MSTIEERFQIRRNPVETWSLREKLCLASAVARNGDQNWMSISRSLKPFAEPNRPSDWFSQKNCAAQYGSLLESVETVVENPVETILKRLTEERKLELCKKMDEETRIYIKQKEQEAIVHAQWLKQRKLEVGRAFRTVTKVIEVVTVQKRKASDSLDASITESSEEAQETSKPTLSPLLTSVLRTHSAITQCGTETSPTIDSLLNTTASASELVSTAINQEPTSTLVASMPRLVSLAKPDITVLSPTPTITNSATKEIISTVITGNFEAKDAMQADTIIKETVQDPEVTNGIDTTTSDKQSKQGDTESVTEKEIHVDKPLKGEVEPGSVEIVEVAKQDKPGRAKRDYSRRKKKNEKDIEILLAVKNSVSVSLEENEIIEESSLEKDSQDSDKKTDYRKRKLKDNTERSNSPWTEEVLPKSRRRLSAPATPSDPVPTSPSGTAILDDDPNYRTWKKSVILVYNRLVTNKYAYLFLKPITEEQAPGYHSIVHRPMDLETIRKNVENGVIRTTQEFHRDVLLMFLNALMYNKRNGTVYKMTRQMLTESLQEIKILLAAQKQDENPVRRETRTSKSGLKRKRQNDFLTKSKKRRDE